MEAVITPLALVFAGLLLIVTASTDRQLWVGAAFLVLAAVRVAVALP